MTDFQPITSQEQLDEIIQKRLAKERRAFEREHGIEEYRKQAQKAEMRAREAEAAAYRRILERDARTMLGSMGVGDRGRQERILKLTDLHGIPADEKGDPDLQVLERRFKELHKDIPEVFGAEAQVGQRALDTSVRDERGVEPLTEEKIAAMSHEEVLSNMDQIKEFARRTLGMG